ncbi:MAG TPA: hypothetical protein VLL82_11100 [Mycobacterium sp.]|nr:hypothetical protein [Mycobacterium sp.]
MACDLSFLRVVCEITGPGKRDQLALSKISVTPRHAGMVPVPLGNWIILV